MHYHNYRVIKNTAEATVEICIECKKRNVIKKDKLGRIDNQAYLKEHIRDTSQPTGPTAKIFARFHGKAEDKLKIRK